MYPESMIDDWEIKMGDVLGYPYAYCIHNRCLNADKTPRKEHVHIMLAFPNTTTYKHAKSVYDGLGVVNKIERCISVRNSYNYLIHDTDSSRKQGKVAYKPEERITGNNFDIGAYEQIGVVDKQKIIDDICDLIDSMGFFKVSSLAFNCSFNALICSSLAFNCSFNNSIICSTGCSTLVESCSTGCTTLVELVETK